MRTLIIIGFAIAAIAVAGCGGVGGTTTVVHKTETQAAAPDTTTATTASAPTGSLTTEQSNFMNEVADKKPELIVKLCKLNAESPSAARTGFVQGYGSTVQGVNGVEAYNYIIANYC